MTCHRAVLTGTVKCWSSFELPLSCVRVCGGGGGEDKIKLRYGTLHARVKKLSVQPSVEHFWNVMAFEQEPHFVFWRNGRVHLNRPGGRQFSRLLAAEVCASAVVMVVMLDTPCSEVECKTTGYPLHLHVSPPLPLRWVTVYHHISAELYLTMAILAYSMEQRPSWEAYRFPASQEIPRILWNA